MADIKTHLGYARAWVRLCLEKKLLYEHLSTLLSEENLLRYCYPRTISLLNLNEMPQKCLKKNVPRKYEK